MKEIIRHKIKHNLKRIETSIKWVLFAIISGVVAGGAGTLFYFGMTLVTLIRTQTSMADLSASFWRSCDRRLLPSASRRA